MTAFELDFTNLAQSSFEGNWYVTQSKYAGMQQCKLKLGRLAHIWKAVKTRQRADVLKREFIIKLVNKE